MSVPLPPNLRRFASIEKEIESPLFIHSAGLRKSKDYDYSADDSIYIDSAVKLQRDQSVSATSEKKKTGQEWSGDMSQVFEDTSEEGLLHEDTKFVNGLPTVVKRDHPTKFYCLKCHKAGTTRVKEHLGKGALALSTIFLFTFFWPCLALVCYSKKCKDFTHECPHCGRVVGKKKFLL